MKKQILYFSLFWLTAFSLILGAVNLPVHSSALSLMKMGSTTAPSVAVNTNASQFTLLNSERLGITSMGLDLGDVDYCVFGWVYLDTAHDGTIICKDDNTNRSWFLRLGGVTAVRWGVNTGGTYQFLDSTFGTLSTGTWYFIYADHDSVNNLMRLSVNNNTIETLATDGAGTASTAEFALGGPSDGNLAIGLAFLDGRLQSVGTAPSILSDANRTSLYNAGVPKGWCQLTAAQQALFNTAGGGWWDAGEASGTRADSSTNAYNLTDFNTVTGNPGSRSGNCL